MQLSKSSACKMEIVGMLLVLISVGSQMFVLEPVRNMETDTSIYVVNTKLDNVWLYLGGIGSNILNDKPLRLPTSWGLLNESWRDTTVVGRDIEKQSEIIGYVVGVLFLFGSALISVGRYHELMSSIDSKIASSTQNAS